MKRGLIVFLALLLVLSLSACSGFYRIEIVGGADLVTSCPKSAKAGETVTVRTRSVTDGWLEVYANGIEAAAIQESVFEFVMPEQDVEVKVLFAWDDLS